MEPIEGSLKCAVMGELGSDDCLSTRMGLGFKTVDVVAAAKLLVGILSIGD